jgi:hypothetical protein
MAISTCSDTPVWLDPGRLADVTDLVHAVGLETGVDLDPDAVRRALRRVVGRDDRGSAAPGAVSRDLPAAVRSRQLTDAEAAALSELLDVLELAAGQADDAGTCLPMLAGIAVAVVDTYRAVVPPPTAGASALAGRS